MAKQIQSVFFGAAPISFDVNRVRPARGPLQSGRPAGEFHAVVAHFFYEGRSSASESRPIGRVKSVTGRGISFDFLCGNFAKQCGEVKHMIPAWKIKFTAPFLIFTVDSFAVGGIISVQP